MKVVKMSDKTNNGKQANVIDQLEGCLKEIKEGTINPDKIVILALDTSDDSYAVSWFQANMRMSECVSLADIAKSMFKREMDF